MIPSASRATLPAVATTVTAHDSFVRGSSAHDGCVVEREALAALVCAFESAWERRHAVANDPLAWIASEIHQARGIDGPKVTREMLNNIMRGESPKRAAKQWVELRYADQIVTVIGATTAFHDGRLRIFPNPRAKRVLRLACCRGTGFTDAMARRPEQVPGQADLAVAYRSSYRVGSAQNLALTAAAQARSIPPVTLH